MVQYLDHTVEMVHRENKICLLMGDFNIDLLKANVNTANLAPTIDIGDLDC
jgi:23S rRNA maturation-related 3'-5' exoribonuclease YhaM